MRMRMVGGYFYLVLKFINYHANNFCQPLEALAKASGEQGRSLTLDCVGILDLCPSLRCDPAVRNPRRKHNAMFRWLDAAGQDV